MKIYAQQGAMEGNKISDGLGKKLVDGVILSPRDNSKDKLLKRIKEYKTISNNSEIYFDPQLYAIFSPTGPDNKLGYLADDYSSYFKQYRRNQLLKEKEVIEALKNTIQFQSTIPDLNAVITPNILIPKSIDSIETAISLNFIRLAKSVSNKIGTAIPVYATLAISREALFNKNEVIEFVNELTALDEPPDGFYLLIEARSMDIRSEIFNTDIVAFWMYLNYALSLNGFKVINGCADIMAPFLAAANGTAAATGWWANLRTFSLEKFSPAVGGGRLPIQRYLSKLLINRITFFELNQLRVLFPIILNDLSTDAIYTEVEEPQRALEILQTWETLKDMSNTPELTCGDTIQALSSCELQILNAREWYEKIRMYLTLDPKSNGDHLDALLEGLQYFKKLAELDS